MRPVKPHPELVVAAITDPHHPIKADVADWARVTIDPADMRRRDRESAFDRDAWVACAEQGLLGALVPTENGGCGEDPVTAALRFEGLGLGTRDTGLAYAVVSQAASFLDAMVFFGTEEQRDELLPAVCAGERIGAFAITEPGAGSDPTSMETVAVRDGDDYLLTGTKAHITLAPIADVALVFAKTDPAARAWGISAFLVHLDRAGVEVTPNHEKMGLRTTPFGELRLDGYRVPAHERVGAEGAGTSIFTTCMEAERALIMAPQLGAAERTITEALARANSREQFGQRIGHFQAVSHRLADMKIAHETARTMMYRAAATLGSGHRAMLEAAMAKVVGSDAVVAIAEDAARIHGARGYMTEFEVEREIRNALGGLFYSGTSDIQRNLIARLMGVS